MVFFFDDFSFRLFFYDDSYLNREGKIRFFGHESRYDQDIAKLGLDMFSYVLFFYIHAGLVLVRQSSQLLTSSHTNWELQIDLYMDWEL